jgi:polyisoprenoid-binding protein YceI
MAQLTSVLLLLLFPFTGVAATLQIDPGQSHAEFLAVGKPSMIKIRGKGASISGSIDLTKKENSGEITVDLDQFDTGIGLRDQHMKEKYLETKDPAKKHARLKITKFDLPAELVKSGGTNEAIPFEGQLTFHGETKPVSGVTSIKVQGEGMAGASKFQINLSEYKVEIPSYLGVKVAETVDIEVNFKGSIQEPGKKL